MSRWENVPEAVATMRREAEIGLQAVHRHLVCVLDGHLESPPYYVVMPWLHGENLADRLLRRGPLPLRQALGVVRQVAEALDALHRAGWAHGDVKPANILVAADGHSTLIDLGFARPLDASRPTSSRCMMGTCAYMAPELLDEAADRPLGPTAVAGGDLFGLGAVMFELLVGRRLHSGDSLDAVARLHAQPQHQTRRRTMLANVAPRDVEAFVDALLESDPDDRPTSSESVQQLVGLEIAHFDPNGGDR